MAIIEPSKEFDDPRTNTVPGALRIRRLVRYQARISRHLDAHEVAQAEAVIEEFKALHGKPETRLEHYRDLVQSLIADPPFLYANEKEFLSNMSRHLSLGREPTERQANWIERIAQRRQS